MRSRSSWVRSWTKNGIALPLIASALALATPKAVLAFCRSTTCQGDCERDPINKCKVTGHPLYWPGPSTCVSFSLQEDGSQFIAFQDSATAIRNSFAAWSNVQCEGGESTLAFVETPSVACRKAEYNQDGPNANIILFQDTRWVYHTAENVLAKTTVLFNTETGEILDADIEINHKDNEFTVTDDPLAARYDLQAIITHEVGHFMGLDHSAVDSATMFMSYREGPGEQAFNQRSLEADDVAAACYVYGPGRATHCAQDDYTPQNGFGTKCLTEGAYASPDGMRQQSCAVESGEGGTSNATAEGSVLALLGLGLASRRKRTMRKRPRNQSST